MASTLINRQNRWCERVTGLWRIDYVMFMSIKYQEKLIVKIINAGQKTTRQSLSPVDLRDLHARRPARGSR